MADTKKSSFGLKNDPPFIQAAYALCLSLHQLTAGFPRKHKFTLGDRIALDGINLLEMAVHANGQSNLQERVKVLAAIPVALLAIRLKLRLAMDLVCLGAGAFTDLSISIDDVARQSKDLLRWAEDAIEGASAGGGVSRRF